MNTGKWNNIPVVIQYKLPCRVNVVGLEFENKHRGNLLV
jgi:hypothetical protein